MKNKTQIDSIINATNGIFYFFTSEFNARLELFAALLCVGLNCVLKVSQLDWIITSLCITVVFSFEILNTSVEHLCNMIDKNYNSKIKTIKDLSAAAVWLSCLVSFIIGCIIYLPQIKKTFL